jgi:hybrid polyketide synthase/nonribosomal peptide synthetase ACE1
LNSVQRKDALEMKSTTFNKEPIAIIGSACRLPGGSNSISKLWDLLSNSRDVMNEIPSTRFKSTGFYHEDRLHKGTTNVRHSYLLSEDYRKFDASFFNVKPIEAESIDPQQRLLLETVYEALEAGGQQIEKLRGSETGVFVGQMMNDYNDLLIRDLESIPSYAATGLSRALSANRVSYFFDWHGPQ